MGNCMSLLHSCIRNAFRGAGGGDSTNKAKVTINCACMNSKISEASSSNSINEEEKRIKELQQKRRRRSTL